MCRDWVAWGQKPNVSPRGKGPRVDRPPWILARPMLQIHRHLVRCAYFGSSTWVEHRDTDSACLSLVLSYNTPSLDVTTCLESVGRSALSQDFPGANGAPFPRTSETRRWQALSVSLTARTSGFMSSPIAMMPGPALRCRYPFPGLPTANRKSGIAAKRSMPDANTHRICG